MLLHSHPIAWGSGSGQQSITAHNSANDQGDLWSVQHGSNQAFCEVGTPIKCGDTIRLTHVATGKNLHSHLFKAPLSGNQEVSGFGEAGAGDTGDNWVVECGFASKNSVSTFWLRDAPVSFKHADTGKFLSTGLNAQFNQQNCGIQCPIMGQTEVSAANRKEGGKTTWTTTQGIYFPPKGVARHDEDDEDL